MGCRTEISYALILTNEQVKPLRRYAIFYIGLLVMVLATACNGGQATLTKGHPVMGERAWKPQPFLQLYEQADLIVYGQVDRVEPACPAGRKNEGHLGPVWLPAQQALVRIHRVLKGTVGASEPLLNVVKSVATYCLEVGCKQVFYLQEVNGQWLTVDHFAGEDRLAGVIANIEKLAGGTGIVVGIDAAGGQPSTVYLLKGRCRAPLRMDEQRWQQLLYGTFHLDPDGVAKISVPPGRYTIVADGGGQLVSHAPLVNGYYPSVIIEKGWRPVYFVM